MEDDIVAPTITDEELVASIQNRIDEINSLLLETYKRGIEVVIDQYNTGTLGGYAPLSNLEMKAKKMLYPLAIRPSGDITFS